MTKDTDNQKVESYLKNCLIERKVGDTSTALFWGHNIGTPDEYVTCALDGYAIIPIEKYTQIQKAERVVEAAKEYIKWDTRQAWDELYNALSDYEGK